MMHTPTLSLPIVPTHPPSSGEFSDNATDAGVSPGCGPARQASTKKPLNPNSKIDVILRMDGTPRSLSGNHAAALQTLHAPHGRSSARGLLLHQRGLLVAAK